MKGAFLLPTALLALFAGAASAAPGDCAAYLAQAKKLNGDVQAVIRQALDEKLDTNGDRCKFRSEEWSIREEKHQAWCSGKDAAAIDERLQTMKAEITACNGDLDQQRQGGATTDTVREPSQPEVDRPIEERTREQLEKNVPAVVGELIGCFRDTSDFDLDGFLERSATNTPQSCIARCASRGFRYAGVQYGESCLCGDTYGRYGAADNCDYACTGDAGLICGGHSANTIYSTGASGATPADGQIVVTSRADDGSTVTFVVTSPDSGIEVVERTPPDPDISIQVVSATWGSECGGSEFVDDTEAVADDCGGYTESCEHLVQSAALPDPAPRCDKSYVVEWTCGKDPTLRRAVAQRRPEISGDPADLFVTLRCGS